MKMEPQVAVITHAPFSRAASLLREAGYLVTKMTPAQADLHTGAEALIVDLRLFDLIQWLDGRTDDDRILIIAPAASIIKGVTARTIRASDIEDDLVSAVDRIVADQRISAVSAVDTSYSPLTSFFGAMAR